MTETLTRAEIEARYPSEWVLVDSPETDDGLEVVRGTVAFHSKDRDELYRKAIELRSKRCAVLYTGEVMPEGTAIVL